MPEVNEKIENNFRYHSPSIEQQAKYVRIRGEAKALAYLIQEACPDGRDKSLAMTKLEEAVFWSNASIARAGDGKDTG